MITRSTLQFLKDIKKNNNRDWFLANRSRYDEAKADFQQFVEAVRIKIALFDPEIQGLDAKDCIYRINRDIRFSKDKTPYKSHMGAYISARGRQSSYPGYYIHLEPGNSMIGGGVYLLEPAEIKKVRQEIDYNGEAFLKILKEKKFRTVFGSFRGEAMKNAPKGYSATNEMLPWLRYKNWWVEAPLTDADMLSSGIEKKIARNFELLKPLNEFFQTAFN